MMIYGKLYRAFMRLAHKYNWYHAPPIYPDGDMQLWCTWCGFRKTYKKTMGLGDKTPKYHYLDK